MTTGTTTGITSASASPTKPAITDNARGGGGDSDIAAVTDAPLDIAAETASLTAAAGGDDAGGCAYFVGVVRGGEVLSMTLEHYPGMTERALRDIAIRARDKWQLTATRIIHRVGKMKPGEAIVFVGAAAKHRAAAFDACRYMADFLKTRAPFWKKEETANGARWVRAKQSDEDALAQWQE